VLVLNCSREAAELAKASFLVSLGACDPRFRSLNAVRELRHKELRHKSVAMTLRYAHLASERKAAAVEMLAKGQPIRNLIEIVVQAYERGCSCHTPVGQPRQSCAVTTPSRALGGAKDAICRPRWKGTLVTITFGLNSSAPLIRSAC
jgi:hypothetical protein